MSTPVCEILKSDNDKSQRFKFACPACNLYHVVPVTGPKSWKWNESLDKPTLSPSLNTHMEFADNREKRRCHLFVRDGKIQYCNDCTHELAGKTVPMMPVKDKVDE